MEHSNYTIYEVCLKSNEVCSHNYFISNEKSKLQLVPFKVFSLGSNALCHPPLPCFHTLLERFLRDASELLRHSFFMSSTSLNLVPLMVPLSFGNKKVTGSQIRGVRRLIHNSNVIFGKEFPDAQSIV